MEIELKIKDDNRNRKPLPTTFYLMEINTVVP